MCAARRAGFQGRLNVKHGHGEADPVMPQQWITAIGWEPEGGCGGGGLREEGAASSRGVDQCEQPLSQRWRTSLLRSAGRRLLAVDWSSQRRGEPVMAFGRAAGVWRSVRVVMEQRSVPPPGVQVIPRARSGSGVSPEHLRLSAGGHVATSFDGTIRDSQTR